MEEPKEIQLQEIRADSNPFHNTGQLADEDQNGAELSRNAISSAFSSVPPWQEVQWNLIVTEIKKYEDVRQIWDRELELYDGKLMLIKILQLNYNESPS